MAPPLVSLKDIHLTFGGTPLLEGAELAVGAGERLCLVGRNGSGKSTLLKVLAGEVEPDRGERAVQQGVTIRYLPQEPDIAGHASTLSYVEAGLAPGDDPYRAVYLLGELGLGGEERPERLSGGEARRAALARALAPRPDLLLLDEPTNHLDLPAIAWLEQEIGRSRAALVLISHDRRFLEALSKVTVWLDRGRTRRLEQGFAGFEAWRDQVLEQEEAERERLDKKIAAETEWVRYGVTARRKRNMGRLRKLQGLRTERREQRRLQGTVQMTTSDAEASGKLVIEATGLGFGYHDRPIVQGLDLRVRRQDRLGIIGPNGAGKTTLLRLLTGSLAPSAGRVRPGANLQMVTLDQGREALDPERGVADTLTDGAGDTVVVGGQAKHVASYMRDFLFTAEQARTPVKALSGGERGRLMLARALARPSNLLVLDEPTNDLDLETLDLLEELLADYAGTVLLVSHDRDFLDRTATAVLAYEGGGRWQDYAGGYTDMMAQRGGRGVEARAAPASPAAGPAAAATARAGGSAPMPAGGRGRLSFKDKRALEQLPARIAALGAELEALGRRLGDPAWFENDPAAFQVATLRVGAATAELAAAEERWLELEILRETLES